MLALQHIHKSYEDKSVLEDINFAVNPGEVIALIGENGAGKTTLLKIILGEIKPDSGTVSLHHEVVGYIPQETVLGSTVKASFTKATEDWRIDYALEKVSLREIPKDTPVSSLSGGQKTRLAFAKVLATQPEPTVLLLDEPTNNLDTDGLTWLTSFIKSFRGGVVLVSHDRTFINKVATATVELMNGHLKHYGGNYDFYKQQKDIERTTEVRLYEEHLGEKKHLEHLIRVAKQRASSGVRRKEAPDKDKYIWNFKNEYVQDSMGGQAKALESRLEQLGEIKRPESVKDYAISLAGDVPQSKLILRLEAVSKSYDRTVLDKVSLEIRGNERVHIKGVNGSGKTTLLKIAAGLLQADAGTVTPGTAIKVGYFSQDVDGLEYDLTGMQNLQTTEAKETAIFREARSLGLTESDLSKKPDQLSRGQQAKLGFAKLLLSSNQLLILDEPTNHLDIPTRERIESALRNYNGAVLFASHDAYFAKTLGPTKQREITGGRLQ